MEKILTPNEKLKLIRKKYGLKQYEITDNKIKRNTISMIETGKNNLTIKTAEILVNKINQLLELKGIEDRVSVEYLTEGTDNQIEKIEKNLLEKLNNNPENENLIEEIDYFLLDKKDSKFKFELYVKIADTYYNKQAYFKSIFYYSKIFEYAVVNETGNRLFSFTFNFITSLYYLRRYSELLSVYTLIEHNFEKYNKTNQLIIANIKRRVMLENEMYKECLADIGKNMDFDLLESDEIYSQSVIHTQAECHYYLKNFSMALELFEQMVNSSFIKLKVLGTVGIALVYRDLDDIDKLSTKLNEINDLLKSIDENYGYKQEIYLNMAKCYDKLAEYDTAEYYLKRIIEISEQALNLPITYNAIKILLKKYSLDKDLNKINRLKEIILLWLSKRYLDKNDNLIFDFIQFYSNENYFDELKYFINCVKNY